MVAIITTGINIHGVPYMILMPEYGTDTVAVRLTLEEKDNIDKIIMKQESKELENQLVTNN